MTMDPPGYDPDDVEDDGYCTPWRYLTGSTPPIPCHDCQD